MYLPTDPNVEAMRGRTAFRIVIRFVVAPLVGGGDHPAGHINFGGMGLDLGRTHCNANLL